MRLRFKESFSKFYGARALQKIIPIIVLYVESSTVKGFAGRYCNKNIFSSSSVVPHITDAVQEWVERVAKIPVDGDNKTPEVCIVEVSTEWLFSYSSFSFLQTCKWKLTPLKETFNDFECYFYNV